MKTLRELIEEASNEDLDYLVERLADRDRVQQENLIEEIQAQRDAEEKRKHCDSCGTYLSCKERKKTRCTHCGGYINVY